MLLKIINKEDLHVFRRLLLEDLTHLIGKQLPQTPANVFSFADVRRMLQISPATLQKLRVEGTLPFDIVGGTHYYLLEEINRLLKG